MCSRWRRTCSGSLGRQHDRRNVERAVEAIRAARLPTFNLDLIYGAAGESLADWQQTVEAVVALDPPHVSAYALTIEAGTPLAEQPDRHPDDDDQADKYEVVDTLLPAAGLENYEISNWARPGHECRHNVLYWRQQDYRGFGCAAHSHRSGRRWWNVRTPDRYIDLVAAGESTEAAGETLDDATRRFEGLELQLRMRDGVPVDALDGDELPGMVERPRRPLGAHAVRPPDGERDQPRLRPDGSGRPMPSGRPVTDGDSTRSNRSGKTLATLADEVVAVAAGPGVDARAVPAAVGVVGGR